MYQEILNFAPENWERNIRDGSCEQIVVVRGTIEFQELDYELQKACCNSYRLLRLRRIQNIHDFGQMILREQFLATTNQDVNYYRVRKYATIREIYVDQALTHNLDPRRCGLDQLIFYSNLNYIPHGNVVIVVQVVTSNYQSATLQPEFSTDYYIEYIANVEMI